MALGAERGRVLRMILLEALGLESAGLVLGALATIDKLKLRGKGCSRVSAFDP
jgi:ABC-type antimicrobial peptide transport system permease subunit